MRPVIVISASFITLVLVTGCSSGPTTEEATKATESSSTASATSASADSFCAAYCEKVSSCDSSQDSQTCTEMCETDVSGTIRKLRSDMIAETKACWQRSDCRQVLSGKRLGDCIDESAVTMTPTPAAKSFCDAFGGALRKCDTYSNYAECLAGLKIFGDDTLEQAKKCTEKSCSAISACIKATL